MNIKRWSLFESKTDINIIQDINDILLEVSADLNIPVRVIDNYPEIIVRIGNSTNSIFRTGKYSFKYSKIQLNIRHLLSFMISKKFGYTVRAVITNNGVDRKEYHMRDIKPNDKIDTIQFTFSVF